MTVPSAEQTGTIVRLALVAVAALAVTLAMPAATLSNPAVQLDLVGNGTGAWNRLVEKQNDWPLPADQSLWRINPTNCTFDINDHYAFTDSGYLPANTTVSKTTCHIFDFDPIYRCLNGLCADWSAPSNKYSVTVAAPTASLAVSVCFDTDGRCFQLDPVWNQDRRQYGYSLCVQAIYDPDDPLVLEIPGSNGARGVTTRITWSVSNPSLLPGPKGTVKNIEVAWGLSSDAYYAGSCTANTQFANNEYPYRWS